MDEQQLLSHAQREHSYFEWMFTLDNINLTGNFFCIKDIREIVYILFYDKINLELTKEKNKGSV